MGAYIQVHNTGLNTDFFIEASGKKSLYIIEKMSSGIFQIQSLPLRKANAPPEYCDANTCHELSQRVTRLENLFDDNIPKLYKRINDAVNRSDNHIEQLLAIMSAPEGQFKRFSWMSHAAGYKRRTLKSKRR